jgi:hypothetical protein
MSVCECNITDGSTMGSWLSLFLQLVIPAIESLVAVKTKKALNSVHFEVDGRQKQLGMSATFFENACPSLPETKNGDRGKSWPEKLLNFSLEHGEEIGQLVRSCTTPASDAPHFDRARFLEQKALQQQSILENRKTLFQLAAQRREITLKLPEVHKILDHWPLRLFPSQLLESSGDRAPLPLKIFLAPPQINGDRPTSSTDPTPDLELSLAQGLREFLSRHYPLHGANRPTEFLGGAWESKRFHSESSIKALYGLLKSEPCTILESEIDGDFLTFRLAYWGLESATYYYQTVFSFSYRQFLQESAKNRALKWRDTCRKLKALGKSPKEIKKLGGENCKNLSLLEETEILKQAGVDLDQLDLSYTTSEKDWQNLAQFLKLCHCLVAGWIADIYYFTYADRWPLLPELLPQLMADCADPDLLELPVAATVTIYRDLLAVVGDRRPYWMPELALNLAWSLTHFPDRAWARAEVEFSVRTWLQLRQREAPHTLPDALERMSEALTREDRPYLETLKRCLTQLGDREAVATVEGWLARLGELTIAPETTVPRWDRLSLMGTLEPTCGKVAAIAIAPDGETLYSCGEDRIVEIWNLDRHGDGQLQGTLKGHSGGILTLTLSGDGRILASSDRSKNRSYIKVWHLETGKLLWTLFGHKKDILCLALTPDGQTLASGSHKIKLWDLKTGEATRTLFGHRQWVRALVFTPDGKHPISASDDGTVKVWDAIAGTLKYTLNGHQGSVRTLAVSPDGKTLVSGSADRTIAIWDLQTGRRVRTIAVHDRPICSVAIAADGQTLISASEDKMIKICNIETGEILNSLDTRTEGVSVLAISASSRLLATGSPDRTLKIWQFL